MLAGWECESCHGSGKTADRCICLPLKGSGRAEISGVGFEREKALDMVSELEGLPRAHNVRAGVRMRAIVDGNTV